MRGIVLPSRAAASAGSKEGMAMRGVRISLDEFGAVFSRKCTASFTRHYSSNSNLQGGCLIAYDFQLRKIAPGFVLQPVRCWKACQ